MISEPLSVKLQQMEHWEGIGGVRDQILDILARYEGVVKAADDLVTALWDLEWAEDMVIGPKLRTFQERRTELHALDEAAL